MNQQSLFNSIAPRDTASFKAQLSSHQPCHTCVHLLGDLSRIGHKYSLLQEAYYIQQNELNNLKLLIGNEDDYNILKKQEIRIKDLLTQLHSKNQEISQIKQQNQELASSQTKLNTQKSKAKFQSKKSITSHSFQTPTQTPKKSLLIPRLFSEVDILPSNFNQMPKSHYFNRIDQIRKLHDGEIYDLQLSPCTLYLATCAHDSQALKITDLYSLQTQTIYQKFDPSEEVISLNFNKDTLIAGTNKGKMKIWETNSILRNFGLINNVEPTHTFNSSTMKPISNIVKIHQTIYTSSDDMVLRHWNSEKGQNQTHILPEVPSYLKKLDDEGLLVGTEHGSVYLYRYKIENKFAIKYQSDWLFNSKIKYIDVRNDKELIISTCRGFEQVDIRNMQSLGIYEQSQGNLTNAIYINEGKQIIQGIGEYFLNIFPNKSMDQVEFHQEQFNCCIKSITKVLYDPTRLYLYVVGKKGEFSYTNQKIF